jgi:hypothetical protein
MSVSNPLRHAAELVVAERAGLALGVGLADELAVS